MLIRGIDLLDIGEEISSTSKIKILGVWRQLDIIHGRYRTSADQENKTRSYQIVCFDLL